MPKPKKLLKHSSPKLLAFERINLEIEEHSLLPVEDLESRSAHILRPPTPSAEGKVSCTESLRKLSHTRTVNEISGSHSIGAFSKVKVQVKAPPDATRILVAATQQLSPFLHSGQTKDQTPRSIPLTLGGVLPLYGRFIKCHLSVDSGLASSLANWTSARQMYVATRCNALKLL